jgi:hypothetical protein
VGPFFLQAFVQDAACIDAANADHEARVQGQAVELQYILGLAASVRAPGPQRAYFMVRGSFLI